MARLYANENFPLPAVLELRCLGHDVLTMQEAGQGNQSLSDEEVPFFAKSEGRALLSLNRKHFIQLHLASRDHAGIIVCSFDPDFTAMAHRIHEYIQARPVLSGCLIRINRPS